MLNQLNETIIKKISYSLGLKPLFVSSKELGIKGDRSQRLLDICNHLIVINI